MEGDFLRHCGGGWGSYDAANLVVTCPSSAYILKNKNKLLIFSGFCAISRRIARIQTKIRFIISPPPLKRYPRYTVHLFIGFSNTFLSRAVTTHIGLCHGCDLWILDTNIQRWEGKAAGPTAIPAICTFILWMFITLYQYCKAADATAIPTLCTFILQHIHSNISEL